MSRCSMEEYERIGMINSLQCGREEPTQYEAPGENRLFALFGLGLMHLSSAAHNVGAALIWHANRHTGRCDPGIETLARETQRDRSTVIRAIKELRRKGVLRRERRGQRSNAYHIDWNRLAQKFRQFQWLITARKSARGGETATSLSGESATPLVARTPPEPMKRTNEENQCPERVHSPPANDTRVVKLPFVETTLLQTNQSRSSGRAQERVFRTKTSKWLPPRWMQSSTSISSHWIGFLPRDMRRPLSWNSNARGECASSSRG